MISKYDGICRYCGLPTKAGRDLYDFADKTSAHAGGCPEDQSPTPDAFALADNLGYREIGWDAIFKVLEGK